MYFIKSLSVLLAALLALSAHGILNHEDHLERSHSQLSLLLRTDPQNGTSPGSIDGTLPGSTDAGNGSSAWQTLRHYFTYINITSVNGTVSFDAMNRSIILSTAAAPAAFAKLVSAMLDFQSVDVRVRLGVPSVDEPKPSSQSTVQAYFEFDVPENRSVDIVLDVLNRVDDHLEKMEDSLRDTLAEFGLNTSGLTLWSVRADKGPSRMELRIVATLAHYEFILTPYLGPIKRQAVRWMLGLAALAAQRPHTVLALLISLFTWLWWVRRKRAQKHGKASKDAETSCNLSLAASGASPAISADAGLQPQAAMSEDVASDGLETKARGFPLTALARWAAIVRELCRQACEVVNVARFAEGIGNLSRQTTPESPTKWAQTAHGRWRKEDANGQIPEEDSP